MSVWADIRRVGLLAGAAVLLGTGAAPVAMANELEPVAEAAALSAPSEYRLGPGDKLRVIVFDEAELTGDFSVSGAGIASLPLIGDVPAAGRSVEQFRLEVEAAYRKGYLKDPRVAVEILNYRPFYILGEVNRPGEYPCIHDLTVMKAVATAQGFTYRANARIVFIKHAHEKTEHKERLTPDTPVEPGDTIRVAERFF